MSASITLNHWLELLGLDNEINQLLAGQKYLEVVRTTLEEKRSVYPSVSQDYVFVLDQVSILLDTVEEQMEQQAESVGDYNEALQEAGVSGEINTSRFRFSYDPGRLLTKQEMEELRNKQEDFMAEIENLRNEMEDLAEEMEDIQEEIEDIQNEIEDLNDQIEDLVSEIEDLSAEAEDLIEGAEADLEAAYEELESAQGDLESYN